MQLIVHVDPSKSVLEVESWMRAAGYRLLHRLDGSVHAIPLQPAPKPTAEIVPLRPNVPNPFLGGAA